MKKLQLQQPTDVDANTDHSMVAVWAMDAHLLASNQPAIIGRATIVYDTYTSKEPVREEVDNPTYRDLLQVANRLIKQSGDEHHIFVEGFDHDPNADVWHLCTGS